MAQFIIEGLTHGEIIVVHVTIFAGTIFFCVRYFQEEISTLRRRIAAKKDKPQ